MVRVRPGRLSLFWAGMPHSVVGGTAGMEDFFRVYLPLVWVLRWGLPEPFMRRLMSGEMLADEPSEWTARCSSAGARSYPTRSRTGGV